MRVEVDDLVDMALGKFHTDLLTAILEGFKLVHPSVRMKIVDISEPCIVVAIGKNALSQAHWLYQFNEKMILHAYVLQPKGYGEDQIIPRLDDKFTFYLVNHPFPTLEDINKSRTLMSILSNLDKGINMVVLISGGASAAFCVPEEGIPYHSYISIVKKAYQEGMEIGKMNQIRSIIDSVKAGKFLGSLPQPHVRTFVTSDVLSDDPRVVGSGPTVGGLEVDSGVLEWLASCLNELPNAVSIDRLVAKIPKNTRGEVEVLTTRLDLVEGIRQKLKEIGLQVSVIDTMISSDIYTLADTLSTFMGDDRAPGFYLFSGEATISLSEAALKNGSGGRLSALTCLMIEVVRSNPDWTFMALASDGRDGTSPVSGYLLNHTIVSKLMSDVSRSDVNQIINTGFSGKYLKECNSGIKLYQSDINLLDIIILIRN